MLIKNYKTTFLLELSSLYDEKEIESFFYLILEKLHGLKRIDLALKPETVIDGIHLKQWKNIVSDLKSYKPIQYILGETEFYGLPFLVNENVLIPRPETEELVDWIVKEVESGKKSTKYEVGSMSSLLTTHHSPLTILDIGTGSGCIPIALKKNLPESEVSAIDVCSEALHTATINAVNNETDINFQLLDFLDESKWNELSKYDIIVSNPPYIKTTEANTMSKHVLEFEPHKALFVPDEDALLFYRKIADFALQHLQPNGAVYVEINQQLGKETVELFQQKGFYVELKKDMSGNERMVKASR